MTVPASRSQTLIVLSAEPETMRTGHRPALLLKRHPAHGRQSSRGLTCVRVPNLYFVTAASHYPASIERHRQSRGIGCP